MSIFSRWLRTHQSYVILTTIFFIFLSLVGAIFAVVERNSLLEVKNVMATQAQEKLELEIQLTNKDAKIQKQVAESAQKQEQQLRQLIQRFNDFEYAVIVGQSRAVLRQRVDQILDLDQNDESLRLRVARMCRRYGYYDIALQQVVEPYCQLRSKKIRQAQTYGDLLFIWHELLLFANDRIFSSTEAFERLEEFAKTNKISAELKRVCEICRLIHDRDYRRALKSANQSFQDFPTSYWLHIAVGYCQQQFDNNLEASEAYSRALEQRPFDPIVRKLRAYAYMDVRLLLKAENDLEVAARRRPNNVKILLLRARNYRLRGSYGRALAAIDKAIRLAPNDSTLRQMKVKILLNERKLTEALPLLEKFQRLPRYAKWAKKHLTEINSRADVRYYYEIEALYNKAAWLFQERHYQATIAVLEPNQEEGKRDTRILNLLAMSYSRVKQFEKALKIYESLLSMPLPTRSRVNYLQSRANLYYGMNKYDLFLNDVRQLLKFRPDSANYYVMQAAGQKKVKDFLGAIQSYSKAIELAPEVLTAHEKRADLLFRTKQYELCVKDCDFIIGRSPTGYATVYFLRSASLIFLGKGRQGLELFRKYVVGLKNTKLRRQAELTLKKLEAKAAQHSTGGR